MKELHALVDFENVQPSLEALAKLAPGFTDVWAVPWPAPGHASAGLRCHPCTRDAGAALGPGAQRAGLHLSFYLGYMAAKHPDAELVVVANDRGYDPMLAHARMLPQIAMVTI